MSVKFKNLAQAGLCGTLEAVLQAEGVIRKAARDSDSTGIQFAHTTLYLGTGVCHYINTHCGRAVTEELHKLNEIYAGQVGTAKHYPVPPASDFDPGDYYDDGTPLSECAFDAASYDEMWGEGEYAQNRWDYIRWLVDYMKNQLRIKEL